MSVTDQAIDFKLGTQLWFTKAHQKSHRESARGPGLGELTKILGSPLLFVQ